MDGCTWTCSVCHTAFPQLTKTKYLCPNRWHCICSSVSVWHLEFQHIVVTIREAITSLLPSHKGAHCVCKKQNSVVDQYQRLKDYFAWLSKFTRLFWKGRKKTKKKTKTVQPIAFWRHFWSLQFSTNWHPRLLSDGWQCSECKIFKA